MSYNQGGQQSQEEEPTYTLGHHYGGATRRNIKPYGNKGPALHVRAAKRVIHNKDSRGSVLCGWEVLKAASVNKIILQDSTTPEKKSQQQSTNLGQTSNRTALLTVEDLFSIYPIMNIEEKKEADKPTDCWVKGDEDSRSDCKNIA